MTTFIVIAVIVLVVIGIAAYVIRQRNREANIARADQLRSQAATRAQSALPPTQDRAAEAEAKAEEARAVAERAQAEADEARVAAAQVEAQHESQVRAADRLDPRVKHKAKDYSPRVGGTVDQQPTPPAEVNADEAPAETAPQAEPEAEPEPAVETQQPADDAPVEQPLQQDATAAPALPRRTPGGQEMPGRPIEQTDSGGGWFTRKEPDSDRT